MEEQPVVLFLGIVGDVAVGIILAAHGFCNRLPMVLGDLMAAELGEGFRFLFVDFAMQLLAVFRGFLDFPFLFGGCLGNPGGFLSKGPSVSAAV